MNEDRSILDNKLTLSTDFTRLIDLTGGEYQSPDIPAAVEMLADVTENATAAANRHSVADYFIESVVAASDPPRPDVSFYRDLFARVGAASGDVGLGTQCLDQLFRVPGVTIGLALPRSDEALLSGIQANLDVVPNYCGARLLRYELNNGPDGMRIDARGGTLRWVPPLASEGSQVTADVEITDGEIHGQAAFKLRVAAPTPIATTVAGDAGTVTAPGSPKGLEATLPASASAPASLPGSLDVQTATTAADVRVYLIPERDAPPPPRDVLRVSDFFRLTPSAIEDGEIRVRLPLYQPPEGYSSEGFALYVYTDQVTDVDGPIWVRVRRHVDFAEDGAVSVELRGIGDPFFIGLPPSARADAAARQVEISADNGDCPQQSHSTPATHPWITHHSTCCQKRNWLGKPVSSDIKICTVDGDSDFQVTVEDFSQQQWDWESTGQTSHESIHSLIDWLYRAKKWFDGEMAWDQSLMDYLPQFNVQVEK